ncbi:hypothetical protein SAMN06295974_3878 [Plantibacter flavus]|uniref:Uncharacterized protein n=1 Tax=Plantibacter flavus TaxID=150123 RepID=A0A3N2BL17_9MICO|nr:hypothetical protein [Plantibacter flavus]ROR75977.1 hypothetical protein EDD42_3928 [Plantibacter flavus]SMG49682.1 hypothetical protein SAMN06295974_3878 [Plantibacter flavus]
MAFGRNKSKGSTAEASIDTADGARNASASTQQKQKKRKPAELLSSVVNESAPGAAIDLLKGNDAFALPNGTAWVGLLLSADAIGGLSMKQKNDATKGSIIELIAADKIQVVATKAMLDDEFLGIVPTVDTLDRMSEYRLLTDARYFWAVFHTSGGELAADAIQDTSASYAEAVQLSRGETSLAAVLPEVWAWGGGNVEPELTSVVPAEAELALVGASTPSASSATSTLADDPLGDVFALSGGETFGGGDDEVDYSALAADDASSGDDSHDFEPFEAQFETEGVGFSSTDENDDLDASWNVDLETGIVDGPALTASTEQPSGNEEAAGYFQYLEQNRDRVVDEDEVRDTIARRFLSSDLDLVVDLAEFERTFTTSAAAITLEITNDPTDWLGSQVAQLSRQANAELQQVHQANADQLRELFVATMSMHVEKTMTLVSPEIPGSQFANLMDGAKKDYDAARLAGPQEISNQRREITERFNAAADSRAEAAAAHARSVYEDKNRPKLERDLAEAGLEVDRRLEERYEHDRQTVLEMRRKEANVHMDVGTTQIFEVLRERQDVLREGERELLERWNNRLIAFIDENRQADIARAMALAQELSRDRSVAQLREEHTARLNEMRSEREDFERRLNEELTRVRQEAVAQLTAREAEWGGAITLEKERTRSSSAVAEQLTAQLSALGAQYEAQYAGKITTLEADKLSAAQELERAAANQKRFNSTLITLVIVLGIAALAVGVILGWSWGASQAPTISQSAPAVVSAVKLL